LAAAAVFLAEYLQINISKTFLEKVNFNRTNGNLSQLCRVVGVEEGGQSAERLGQVFDAQGHGECNVFAFFHHADGAQCVMDYAEQLHQVAAHVARSCFVVHHVKSNETLSRKKHKFTLVLPSLYSIMAF
jgi:hypothetical protein